ncbi:MAG TPA: hypothetical protein VGP64_12200 [Polyangia bacterium]|jgi:hypothetical protein
MARAGQSRAGELGRGLLVGLCATTALDWVGTLLYEAESPAARDAEGRARRGRFPYEVAVARTAERLGRPLSEAGVAKWGWRFHKTFGLLGGIGYLALRRAFPRIRWGRGLAFGAAFFLLVDELLPPLQKLSPGPRAFSWKVHARGAAAHVAYGVAAEAAAGLVAP